MKHILYITTMIGILTGCLSCEWTNQSELPKVKDAQNTILTKKIEAYQAHKYFTGLAVALVDSSTIHYEKGFGLAQANNGVPYTEHSVQAIASVSKMLIGLSLLKTQEMGLLQLDDPIQKHLSFPVIHHWHPTKAITIRQLATHSAGIIDTENYMNHAYVLIQDSLKNQDSQLHQEPHFQENTHTISLQNFLYNYLATEGAWYKDTHYSKQAPGEHFAYSNVGASLAAYIIEEVSGMSYADFTQKYILDPLGMHNSYWKQTAVPSQQLSYAYDSLGVQITPYALQTYPDGGLYSSAHDLGLLLRELINAYNGNGSLLHKESYKSFFQHQLSAAHYSDRDPTHPYDDEYATGLFIGRSGTGNIGHSGGDPGVASLFFFHPEKQRGQVLLVNTNISSHDAMQCFYGIFDLLANSQDTTLKSN